MIRDNDGQRIDFHVHAFPDDLATAALERLSARSGLRARGNGTLAGLQATLRAQGLDGAVIQPVATKPTQVRAINQQAAAWNRLDGLASFGSLHPDLSPDAMDDEIGFLRAQGVRGVKLHPEFQAFYPDEDRLERLYQALSEAGLWLLLHAGADLCFQSPVKAAPSRIAQVVRAFPRLRVIAAHFGGFRLWRDVERHLVGLPVWLDTAYCAGQLEPQHLSELARAHGIRRVLLGSDAPWGEPGAHVEYVCGSGLTEEETRAVLGNNAVALLNDRAEG